jgi:hypothetical protein
MTLHHPEWAALSVILYVSALGIVLKWWENRVRRRTADYGHGDEAEAVEILRNWMER